MFPLQLHFFRIPQDEIRRIKVHIQNTSNLKQFQAISPHGHSKQSCKFCLSTYVIFPVLFPHLNTCSFPRGAKQRHSLSLRAQKKHLQQFTIITVGNNKHFYYYYIHLIFFSGCTLVYFFLRSSLRIASLCFSPLFLFKKEKFLLVIIM